MNSKKLTLSVLIMSLALISYSPEAIPMKSLTKGKTTFEDKSPTKINFYKGSYDDFLREAKLQKKPILLDFWAIWCGPCKKLDTETLGDAAFSQYLNTNFMTYRIDIDTFDGMEIADRFAVDTFPTLIMLDQKGKYINRFRGFFPPKYLQDELQKNKDSKGKRFAMPKEKGEN